MKRRLMTAVTAAAVCLLSSGNVLADEGMWTFDNFPAATVKAKYGIDINQNWLDKVRASSVRLNGCSASVVSRDGLVLTNHHCVRGCAQSLSTGKINYVEDGFFAATRKDEKMCPGMTGEILENTGDVTARIIKAGEGKTGADYVKARDAAVAAIEKEGCAGKEAKYRCQVISLYQGGQYKLYTYRKYNDVRLVAAPEEPMAFFGGDPDNFNFPRYDLDFSFIRLYEDGKPVSMPDNLKWSTSPPRAGEAVFVAGNPGSTDRLLTADQLQTLRDYDLPSSLIQLSEMRGQITRFAEEDAEHARISNSLLFGVENSFKALYGREDALISSNVVVDKRKSDQELRAKVMADPKLSKEIGDPWAEIANLLKIRKPLTQSYTYMEGGPQSSLFGYARALVRAAEERGKPNSERLPAYTDSRLPIVEKGLLDARPIYPDLEQINLEFWLTKLREKLTADSEGTKIFLGKDSPRNLAARLIKSKLADSEVRKALWEGGSKAIQASDDPMIRYVLATDKASRDILNEYRAKVSGPIERAAEKIAKARFAIYGTSTYPDATFSLRLSFGKVAGWKENGKDVAPFTYYSGLWERATGQFPFALPARWATSSAKVNGKIVFDFVTTNDIIGGNSGSPMINAKGEVIGAAFDGNIHSLGGAYFFDETDNRTVGVTTVAITEALTKVYGQKELVKELTGK